MFGDYSVFYKRMAQLISEVARMEGEKGERSKPQATMVKMLKTWMSIPVSNKSMAWFWGD